MLLSSPPRRLSSLALLLVTLFVTSSAGGAPPPCAETVTAERLSPHPTSQDLTDLTFTGEAWMIVGSAGTVLRADPELSAIEPIVLPPSLAGLHWEEVTSNDTVITLRAGRTYAFSDDNGTNWRHLALPVDGQVLSTGTDHLVVVPARGQGAWSDDGGGTWSTVDLDAPQRFEGRAEAVGTGLFVSGRGGLLESRDQGQTWSSVNIAEPNPWLSVVATSPDGTSAWAAGRGVLLRTTDGQAWEPVQPPLVAPFVDIAIPDHNHVFVLASDGLLLRSDNAGAEFAVQELPAFDLTALHFRDALHGVALGARGAVLVTADGGATWRDLRRGTTESLRAIVAADGALTTLGVRGTRLSSHDGFIWAEDPPLEGALIVDAVAAGDQLLAVSNDTIQRTATASSVLTDVDLAPALDGWSRVLSPTEGRVFGLSNQGLVALATGEVLEVPVADLRPEAFATAHDKLLIGGDDGLAASADGGLTFARLGPSLPIARAALADNGAIAVLTNGMVVEISDDSVRLLGLEPHAELSSALRVGDDGWFGGGGGVVVRVRGDDADVFPALRSTRSPYDQVVAIEEIDRGRLVAMAADGRLALGEAGGESWTELAPAWPRVPTEVGMLETSSNEALRGALHWYGDGGLAVGFGGQVRRLTVADDATSYMDLPAPVGSDLFVLNAIPQGILAAGDGRTLIWTADAGQSWVLISDDLAPEAIIGLQFESTIRGFAVTDTGRFLRMGDDLETMAWTETRRFEQRPVALFDAPDGPTVITANGSAIQTADDGTTWTELARFGSAVDLVATGPEPLYASVGQLSRMTAADETTSSVPVVPALPRLSLLTSGPAGEVLGVGDGGQVVVFTSTVTRCGVPAVSLVGTRAAIAVDGSWIVVGDGGLIARVDP